MALIKIGNQSINQVFFGNIKIAKIYFNKSLIYSKKQ